MIGRVVSRAHKVPFSALHGVEGKSASAPRCGFPRIFRVEDLQIHDALVRAGAKIGVSGTGGFPRIFWVGDLQIHDALVRAGAKIGVSGTGKG